MPKITAEVPKNGAREEAYFQIKKLGIIKVVHGSMLLLKGGVWHNMPSQEIKIELRSLFADHKWQTILSDGCMKFLINSLMSDPDVQEDDDAFRHPDLLLVGNGILNVRSGELYDQLPEPTMKFRRKVDIMYDAKSSESEVFNTFCESVFDENSVDVKRKMLYEIIGYCLTDVRAFKVACFFVGPANCGKSTLIQFIQKVLGSENFSNVSLSQFGEKFHLPGMIGKVLNVHAEVSCKDISRAAFDNFKAITGADNMTVEAKGKQPYATTLNIKLLFAGNNLPNLSASDGTNSYIERLHVLRFDHSISAEQQNEHLIDDLWKERDIIISRSLIAFRDVLQSRNTFTKSKDEDHILHLMTDMANPVAAFIRDKMEFGEDYASYITDVYDVYKRYVYSMALPVYKLKDFSQQMCSQHGVYRGDGKKRLATSDNPRAYFQGVRLKQEAETE